MPRAENGLSPIPSDLAPPRRLQPINLSVEEENLASIPFAVLEQRVGKKTGSIEVRGQKILPDGTPIQATWQVQGNAELGLPTEQDMDIFVALGVLTFRHDFAKTITFTGREIARILNRDSVNGRFYKRIKLAMDRFVPLRFRTLMCSDRHEDIKWVNVFQDASFTLDRDTGRCVGSVTWTDKIIDAMDRGFFRLLDGRRYMELDGLTTKHMYRFLAVAFERTDVVLIDARELASRHLGIVNVPKYLSRLMQTLEPAFEQLRRQEVVGSWHVLEKATWRISIRAHANYVPAAAALTLNGGEAGIESRREQCRERLAKAGLDEATIASACDGAETHEHFYSLERLAHLMERISDEEVLTHVVRDTARRVVEAGPATDAGRDLLDWVEIALHICAQKRRNKEKLRNVAGFIVKVIRDEDARRRLVPAAQAQSLRESYRRREEAARAQQRENEERLLVIEYENYRAAESAALLAALPEDRRNALRDQKLALLRQQERVRRLSEAQQFSEAESLVREDLARKHVAALEKWRVRRMARQAVLALFTPEEAEWNTAAAVAEPAS